MIKARHLPIVLLAVAGNAFALDHTGASPAAHMQLKDAAGVVVCAEYNTAPGVIPVATDCPAGPHTEQLFDTSWAQIGERSVVIGDGDGGDVSSVARVPVRVERTCELDYDDLRQREVDIIGENINPYCAITCPAGVAIDGEATASIPLLNFTDDAIFHGTNFTVGTGEQTIKIYMVTNIAREIAYETFSTEIYGDGFGDLIYEIKAATVCL